MRRKAILIIHGFAGGTYDEENLANVLEFVKNFDVFSFTLPGHESRKDKATREDWINSARSHIEMLINHGYKDIYVIGHSMGGVIASIVASEYKEVKKLVLAAAAFQYLNSYESKLNVRELMGLIKTNVSDYSAEEIYSRFLKMPLNSLKEFMSIVKENQDVVRNINIPTLIIHGSKDKLVPLSSSTYIYDNIKSKNKYLYKVKRINHDVFNNDRQTEVCDLIVKFLKTKFYFDTFFKKEI